MKEINVTEVAEAVKGKIIHCNKEIRISSVTTNSKDISQGGLFVPIIGERVDGHDFIEDAKNNGALACFTSKDEVYNEGLVCIKVQDTLQALQDLAAYYRNKFSIPVIGITGSVGKTSTKEIISSVLSTKYNVLKTAGNMNSQVGLPLMMLRLEDNHDIAVIEMGISEEGEMERLARIARPDIAVVTNIGVAHIANLKTKENIRKAKLNIINEFSGESCLFVSGDSPLLGELIQFGEDSKDNKSSHKFDKIDLSPTTYNKLNTSKVISYGLNECSNYRAQDIKVIDGRTYFTLLNPNKGTKEDIVLNVIGKHNINNSLCALALADFFEIPINMAKKGLEDYRPIAMRGEIKKAGNITIIDDTYNASPDSMKSGIDMLLSLTNVKRRIAVLADVLELGDVSKECHYEVGVFIRDKNVDEVITIGDEARYIAKGLIDSQAKKTNSQAKKTVVNSFDNNKEAIEYLDMIIKSKDAVLIKGSRGMKTEEIVNFLLDKYK